MCLLLERVLAWLYQCPFAILSLTNDIHWSYGKRPMNDKVWKIYLSGEIHSDWREQIENGCAEAGLPVVFAAPITEHDDSDDCGVAVFGSETDKFWHDHKGALLNSVRTGTLIEDADVVVVRFG